MASWMSLFASFLLEQPFLSSSSSQRENGPPAPSDCICPTPHVPRWLQEEETSSPTPAPSSENEPIILWQVIYTSFVLFFMLVALISDRVGADSVMLTALTAFMVANILTVDEAIAGFSNEGLLTILVLLVVAQGLNKTGALDWYMGHVLLGHPKTTAAAQLKLVLPMAVVSAFLNNTPVVAIMIPIVQRWAATIKVSRQQLLIPLSFASILGGTCTLIGTSTNLVVAGLLEERYPNDPSLQIGLFDLGQYGVPVAMAGIAYMILCSPFLLPGGGWYDKLWKSKSKDGAASSSADPSTMNLLANSEDILLGARVTQWSPAVGRTVQRSGLRDTGGIYLVSVHRAATGNVHRAVSSDFVVAVNDICYFTGLVESFGDFCEEHGLEVVTNEVMAAHQESGEPQQALNDTLTSIRNEEQPRKHDPAIPDGTAESDQQQPLTSNVPSQLLDDNNTLLATVQEEEEDQNILLMEVGVTKESLLQADEAERLRNIHRMTDMIRGAGAGGTAPTTLQRTSSVESRMRPGDPTKIVVTIEKDLVVVGINAQDRPGLMLDISKGLLRLNLELHHTEAAVVNDRSVSIWRCETSGTDIPDLEEIWSVLSALLSNDGGVEAIKKRGLRVIRARVLKGSRLVGKTATEVDFRTVYKAAIVALQKGGKNVTVSLSTVQFEIGDVLVLQASDDSPLLRPPPEDFYHKLAQDGRDDPPSRMSSVNSLVNLFRRTKSSNSLRSAGSLTGEDGEGEVVVSRRVAAESKEIAADASQDEEDFFVPSGDGDQNLSADTDNEAVIVMDTDVEDSLRLEEDVAVWKDLVVVFKENGGQGGAGAAREFLAAMEVAPNSNLAGKTAAKAAIDKLPDLFLVSIERPVEEAPDEKKKTRLPILAAVQETSSAGAGSNHDTLQTDNQKLVAIPLDEPLKEGDILWFSGPASSIGDLRKIPGLISYENEEVKKINEKVHDRRLVQAVIARNGPLVGKTVKEARFRTQYGAAVIAVHREGKRIHQHPGTIKLQAGDVLLLEAGVSFLGKKAENDRSFTLLAEVEDSAPPRLRQLIPALIITVAMLAVFTAGVASLLECALVASILMVALGILSESEAREAVNWEIYVIIASAFGIGTALQNSGVAGAVADFMVSIGSAIGLGDAGLLGAVYFATFLISNVVTNNAAAALLFPIAMDAAEQTGTDLVLMSYCLMLGASASFMSPFGYQTNLMVYGPGGYTTKDFLLFGTPMQLVLWILSILYLSVIEPWYVSWVSTAVVMIVICVARVGNLSLLRTLWTRSQTSSASDERTKSAGSTDDST